MLCRLLTTALVAALVLTAAPPTVSAVTSFGYTTGSDKYIISTGKGLTVTMKQSTCDITSINYNGKELQYKSKATHVNSGLDRVTSSIKTLSDSKKTIRVICKKTGLEQTYLYRPNENVIYMGTYHSNDLYCQSSASLRVWINRPSTLQLCGVYFVVSDLGYETSSGGPFFRDINNKLDVSNELTFYMNSDHTRTEDYRYGFHGPCWEEDLHVAAYESWSLHGHGVQETVGSWYGIRPHQRRGDKDQSISVSYNMTSNPIWRIGEWDGTPNGFLNADKIHKMHPSDYRMSPWKALTFKVDWRPTNAEDWYHTAQSSGRSSVTVNALVAGTNTIKLTVASGAQTHPRSSWLLLSYLTPSNWCRATAKAVAQANTNQLTSNLNFQSAEERASTTSFGYKEDGGSWVIDSGAGLTVKVNQGSCDITSMVWNKAELQISKKMTHINSGLGKSVKSSIESLKDKTIQISCKATGLEHTYLFRPMRTPSIWPLNNPMVPASKIDGMKAIEAHDVYADSKGVTASKFYSGIPSLMTRFTASQATPVVCSSSCPITPTRGLWVDHSSVTSTTCTEANELTFYMFSDHTRFEDYRYGFHGPISPYRFRTGDRPWLLDRNYYRQERCAEQLQCCCWLLQADAQYWVKVDSTTKPFTSPKMVPGTYNTTIYKNQLPVSSEAITIAGGSAPASAPASTEAATPAPASNGGQRRAQSVEGAKTLTVRISLG
ncbi:Rhamnogalacturonan lyase, domain II [Phytophthora cactorum]|nr:Rhamnogalacturonan lyase, domain II [Phytophthora cactorum]